MPPVFEIQYTSPHQQHAIRHTIEWICPAAFTEQEARDTFLRRFPGSAVFWLSEIGSQDNQS